MKTNDKKYRRSGVAVACYVIAALLLIYVCYLIGSTVATINEYYAQYGMSATAGEYVSYIIQQALQPLVYAIVVFMLGFILDAVRKNNPAYYLSDEELEEAKIAKREAREAKKFAKGEAAAAKAGNIVTDEASVEAEFAKSLDEELKADEQQSERKKSNRNYQNRNHNRQGQGKKKSEAGEGKSADGKGESKEAANKGDNKAAGNKEEGKSENKGENKGGNRGGNSRRGGSRKPKAKPDAKEQAAETAEKTEAVFEATIEGDN